ncbi:MAG: hypothetical protein LBU27_08135 [Candidatus Peribacteria bacterium]|nr:hypothetical protein [Candidatus Peribacteria bacterium]
MQTGGAKTNKTKLSILIPYSYLMPTIKEYKQLSHVTLKDGRVLTSESTPLQLYNRLENHAHIYLQESGEVHSKFSIVSIIPARFDDIEGFILSQSKGMQNQLREKIRERKEELGLATDLNYIQNYVKEHTI